MLESAGYRVLSLSAHRVLARLEIELGHHGGNGNGFLACTFEHFVAYGIDRHAVAPALRELEALGFIEVTERGCAGNREFRTPSRYRITFLPTEYEGATHEWKRIRSVEQAERIAAAARRAKKRKASAGQRTLSLAKTDTENANPPVGEIPTTDRC